MAVPFEGWGGFALLALLLVTSVIAQPVRIFLSALVCKFFKVPDDKIADFALRESQKRRPNPAREVITALAALVAAARGKGQ